MHTASVHPEPGSNSPWLFRIPIACSLKTRRKRLNGNTINVSHFKRKLQIALTFTGVLFSLHIATVSSETGCQGAVLK
jgi:hypothetical protein